MKSTIFHPIAQALRDAYPEADHDGCSLEEVEEIAGHGIKAKVNGRKVCVGNNKMMQVLGIGEHTCELVGTIIHIAIDGIYAGHIVINDRVKPDGFPSQIETVNSSDQRALTYLWSVARTAPGPA